MARWGCPALTETTYRFQCHITATAAKQRQNSGIPSTLPPPDVPHRNETAGERNRQRLGYHLNCNRKCKVCGRRCCMIMLPPTTVQPQLAAAQPFSDLPPPSPLSPPHNNQCRRRTHPRLHCTSILHDAQPRARRMPGCRVQSIMKLSMWAQCGLLAYTTPLLLRDRDHFPRFESIRLQLDHGVKFFIPTHPYA